MQSEKFSLWEKNCAVVRDRMKNDLFLVRTEISEYHAGNNHYVDKRSLCDEEIGFGPGLETLIYSCLTSEYNIDIYNVSVGERYHLP